MKYLVVLAVVCAAIGLSEVEKLFLQKITRFSNEIDFFSCSKDYREKNLKE